MTSINDLDQSADRSSKRPPTVGALAACTLVATVAFTALGVFGDGSPGAEADAGEFFVISFVGAVAVALVFGLGVARLAGSPKAGPVGLTFSVLGLLTIVAFWAGITLALAVGGMALGASARRHGHRAGVGTAAVVIGSLAVLGYSAVYISDWVSTNGIL